MRKRIRTAALAALSLALGLAACSSTIEREYDRGELAAESAGVGLSVQSLRFTKAGNLRVQATVENRTEETVYLSYGAFKVELDGLAYPGALRVPFVRVTKSFDVEPRTAKQLPGPLEFRGVPRVQSVTLVVRNVRKGAEDAEPSAPIRLELPLLAH